MHVAISDRFRRFAHSVGQRVRREAVGNSLTKKQASPHVRDRYCPTESPVGEP